MRKLVTTVGVIVGLVGFAANVSQVRDAFLGWVFKIESFAPDRPVVVQGDAIVLRWKTSIRPDEVMINNRQQPGETEGEVRLEPRDYGEGYGKKAFRLTAKKFGLSHERECVVTVEPPALRVEIDATPHTVSPGEAVRVSWSVANAKGRVHVEGRTETGVQLQIGEHPARGEWRGPLEETTTFVVTAKGPTDARASNQVTVVVSATTLSLRVEPSSVYQGESAKLVWESNASEVVIEGVGTFGEAAGEAVVVGERTTSYVARATGPGGEVQRTVTLEVLAGRRPPALDVKASSTEVTVGQSVELSWTAAGADQVVLEIDGRSVKQATTGQTELRALRVGPWPLRLIAEGPGGRDEETVRVLVVGRRAAVLPTAVTDQRLAPLAEEVETALRSRLRERGFEVVPAASGSPDIKEFSAWWKAQPSRPALELVAQARADTEVTVGQERFGLRHILVQLQGGYSPPRRQEIRVTSTVFLTVASVVSGAEVARSKGDDDERRTAAGAGGDIVLELARRATANAAREAAQRLDVR
jgi:hypothetical protein